MKAYSVFDTAVAAYSAPFYAPTDAAAIRSWTAGVNNGSNPNNGWFYNSEDFHLFYIGEFDDSTGALCPSLPRSIITAAALKIAPALAPPKDYAMNCIDELPQ